MSNSSSVIIHGWVGQPNGRGTFDIILSCFLTISLCTWTSLHLNVPASNEGQWRPILRKLRWMMLTLLGPEFVVALAAGQRANAKRTYNSIRGMGYSEWTLRHSFYANMGGFVLQARDSKPFPIYGLHITYLLKEGYLNLPEITSEEISDKSKADNLAKALVCLQTGWFVVQCFSRLAQGLPLAALELITMSYVWCTWAIYAQWLKKPLDVTAPTILRTQASIADILLNAGPRASEPYRQSPLDFVWDGRISWTLDVQPFLHFRLDPRERPIPRILNDSLPWLDTVSDVAVCFLVIVFYGAIHMFGWNFVFPTRTEKILWRATSLVAFCAMWILCIWEVLWGIFRAVYTLHLNKRRKTLRSIYDVWANKVEELPIRFKHRVVTYEQMFVFGPIAALYLVSRLYILAEALGSLRALPSGCFQNVYWTTFIPHF